MKRRFLTAAVSAALCISTLSGCITINNNDGANSDNEELLQIVDALSDEVQELHTMATLPEGVLEGETTQLSDDEAGNLEERFEEAEQNFLSAPTSGTQVKERDWSKYSSDTALDHFNSAEAAFYKRADEVCRNFISNPTNFDENNYIIGGDISFSDLGLTEDQAKNVFYCFRRYNPQYYFLLNGCASSSTEIFTLVLDCYTKLDDPGKTTNEMFDKLDSWIAECSDDEVTAWDKISSINKLICENIIYSPDVLNKVEGAAGDKNQSMYSVLMSDDTVCAGYALTFEAMANAVGIDTYAVVSVGHAFNYVQLDDGKYYLVDVCWNDLDPGYSESYLGTGENTLMSRGEYAAEKHTCMQKYKTYIPELSKDDYNGSDKAKLDPVSIRVAGRGGNITKLEWDAVAGAEKYIYKVVNGSTTYLNMSTTDNFAYVLLPDGVNSATVQVQAQGTQNGKMTYSKAAEITVKTNSDYAKPNKPQNVNVDKPSGIRIKWDKDTSVDGWLLIIFGEDNTLTKPWIKSTLKTDIIAAYCTDSWLPQEYNYFCLYAIKNSSDGELYSDPAIFKYNINDGMKMLSGAEGSVNSTIPTSSTGSQTNSGNTGSSVVNIRYTNGVYVGEMSNGHWNGHGKFTWDNGDVYEGEWKDGKQNGYGKMTWANDDVYEGEWKNDMFDGHGIYTFANGNVYDGEWKDGKQNGYGKMTWANDDVYEGEWKDGNINGHGKYTWANGSVREGEWKDGNFLG